MPTSGCPSSVPPNHAASNPSRVSTIVDAWADRNGAFSNTKPDDTIAAGPSAAATAVAAASSTAPAVFVHLAAIPGCRSMPVLPASSAGRAYKSAGSGVAPGPASGRQNATLNPMLTGTT